MPRRKIQDNLEYRKFMHAAHFDGGSKRLCDQQEDLIYALSVEGLSLLAKMQPHMPGSVAIVRRDLSKIVRKARKKGLI